MSKGLKSLEQDTKETAQRAEELKEKFSDIEGTLKRIEQYANNGKYVDALKEYNMLLKHNEKVAKKLNLLMNERIDLTKENLDLIKSAGNLEWSNLAEGILDKLNSALKKAGGSEISKMISGAVEAASYFAEDRMFETSFKDMAENFLKAFLRGYKKEAKKETELIIEDIQSVLSAGNMDTVTQEEQKNTRIINLYEQRISKQKEIIDEGKRAWVFDIDDAIKQYETEIGELWKFTEEGQELYKNYFAAKKSLYEAEGKDILEVYREQKDFENETTKFYQERERASVEEKYNEDKIALKNQLADGIITREEYAQKQEELTIRYLEDEIALRNSYGKDTTDLEEQLADMRLTIREREEEETAKANAAVADVEKDSQKTRLEQWKDYAEKAAEISQKISEGTKMVTDSLGSMFGQLGSYYADQVQAFTDKINALDEEKEAALERVALSEEERQAKENEIALQKIELEYATSEEQRSKADERIATLQGELSAEDTINREFGDKKTQLEKEKAKKEKEQKKAEKMEKRLQMSQAIVEAIGNVAAGAAKGLTYGPILGPIMAAIVAAAGAVQVGIMTKQLTKMKDGGLLRGFSHSQGGMRIMGSNVEVEGGEYVVNKQSTSKNLGLLEYINGERRGLGYSDMNTFFEQSSATPSLISQMMNEPSVVPQLPMKDSVDTQILSAIERINFQPRVSVTDINTVHDNMVKVDEWTGL